MHFFTVRRISSDINHQYIASATFIPSTEIFSLL